MRKMALLTMLCLALLTGCGRTEAAPAEAALVTAAPVDVEIKEKMFLTQINDMYVNSEEYLGKTIRYEGIFQVYQFGEGVEPYYGVIRRSPGCCGNDGTAGFEVRWDKEYPQENDWVEAVGVLEEYLEDDFPYLRLALTSLTVLPTRGLEFVSQ